MYKMPLGNQMLLTWHTIYIPCLLYAYNAEFHYIPHQDFLVFTLNIIGSCNTDKELIIKLNFEQYGRRG